MFGSAPMSRRRLTMTKLFLAIAVCNAVNCCTPVSFIGIPFMTSRELSASAILTTWFISFSSIALINDNIWSFRL